jgi:hypothetical protein
MDDRSAQRKIKHSKATTKKGIKKNMGWPRDHFNLPFLTPPHPLPPLCCYCCSSMPNKCDLLPPSLLLLLSLSPPLLSFFV